MLAGDTVEVVLHEPTNGVTPGQGAVFFAGEVCLGGGLIAENKAKQSLFEEKALSPAQSTGA